ncbi:MULTISPECIES: sn-glycerol-3-phosphate ABC transporter permease UgpA [unclassified Minwuia]|jgi:sn-glycerol 3-phosphate transport system permease protein|uniref:sn-glycerol-3-phosphate ABC transporter permease UgpA n=1 Tax=unclassified Minwuia TaxID=2618799 RepID=UPI002479F9F9|nr:MULTISPECIES: sn-glycerol-3-phosphate ABC transporter permease UgpA [unclassified Minwuia]
MNSSPYRHRMLPWLLVLPQLAITLVFFIWPASQALWQSVLREDAWGLSQEFVGFENFADLFADPLFLESFRITFVFSFAVAALSMVLSLLLAINADRVVRGNSTYRTLLIWPYAIAPALAGVLWFFMFNPTVGILSWLLKGAGYDWNHHASGTDAMLLVIMAAAWKQISYNFLFFLAGLQAIPKSLIEAAAIDGAGPVRRFWSIILPLLSPTTFFLLVVNVVYAFFDTFGLIHATTEGGPAGATQILVYKVYSDGFVGLDLGGSAAQSVILMTIVIALTVVQFRYVERKVAY